jgi:hypothetical protein
MLFKIDSRGRCLRLGRWAGLNEKEGALEESIFGVLLTWALGGGVVTAV